MSTDAPTSGPRVVPIEGRVYLAAKDLEEQLLSEIGACEELGTGLYLRRGAGAPSSPWAQNIWLEPFELHFTSIGEAARALRGMQRNWALHGGAFGRAKLIQEQLPHVGAKPIEFPKPAPAAPLGAWTLVENNLIIGSAKTTSAFAGGTPQFVENKDGPPNRAYLKLWEALTVFGDYPQPGELCVELGSSPGGWTWVLQGLGAKVWSYDKAPLDPKIAVLPGVTHHEQSGFSLVPEKLPPVDWLLSDMACYPEKLFTLVKDWIDFGNCRRIVATLKFQQGTDYAIVREFATIPGGRLVHLSQNKHELTFFWRRPT